MYKEKRGNREKEKTLNIFRKIDEYGQILYK